MKGELDEADRILHEAARRSHELDNKNAIIYTYDMVRFGVFSKKMTC